MSSIAPVTPIREQHTIEELRYALVETHRAMNSLHQALVANPGDPAAADTAEHIVAALQEIVSGVSKMLPEG